MKLASVQFSNTEEVNLLVPEEFRTAAARSEMLPTQLYDCIRPCDEYTEHLTNGNGNKAFILFWNVGAGSGKSSCDTNMLLPARLPSPDAIVVYKIFVMAEQSDLDIVKRWTLQFIVGNKWYVNRPVFSLAKCAQSELLMLDMLKKSGCVPRELIPDSDLWSDNCGWGIPIVDKQQFFAYLITDSDERPKGRVYLLLDGIGARGWS